MTDEINEELPVENINPSPPPSKKTSKGKRPKKTKPVESNIEDDVLKQYFAELATDATEQYVKNLHKLKKKIDVENQIHNILTEYLNSYILVGYNSYTKERVMLRYADAEQSDDSIHELFKLAFIKIMNERAQDLNGGEQATFEY
jgi:ABC-type phosphate/phosphonate transport system ATPase subunit